MSDCLVDWQLLPVTHQKLGLSLFPSIHLHPLTQKILDTGFRLLMMVLKITELVLTLEGVVEGGGGITIRGLTFNCGSKESKELV